MTASFSGIPSCEFSHPIRFRSQYPAWHFQRQFPTQRITDFARHFALRNTEQCPAAGLLRSHGSSELPAFNRPAFATGFSRWEECRHCNASRLQPDFLSPLQTDTPKGVCVTKVGEFCIPLSPAIRCEFTRDFVAGERAGPGLMKRWFMGVLFCKCQAALRNSRQAVWRFEASVLPSDLATQARICLTDTRAKSRRMLSGVLACRRQP